MWNLEIVYNKLLYAPTKSLDSEGLHNVNVKKKNSNNATIADEIQTHVAY